MPTKVNVKGNRSLRKSSRKSSKKTSKKGLDFTSVLSEDIQANTDMEQMGMNMMGPMGPMNPMMNQMMGPNSMGEMMGMPMGPSMGMPAGAPMQNMMMLGKDTEKNIDPLHVQYMVPHNQNYNINNYGISPEQLLKGSDQMTGISQQFNNMHMGTTDQTQGNQQGAPVPMQMPQMNTQVQQIQKQ